MNSPYMGKFRISQLYKGVAHDGLDLVGVDSKTIHSTVNGVVLYAGWENSFNHRQGFGQYVKIRHPGGLLLRASVQPAGKNRGYGADH